MYPNPFTACQWQELEQQALVFKYILSGIPVPPDLIFTVQRSLDSSLSSNHHRFHGFHGFGRKIDPEPGRCRRTDGKKWRCSKDAHQDSKYCERHMHRGRNRSRKPVELQVIINNNNNTNTTIASSSSSSSARTTTLPSSEPPPRFLYDPSRFITNANYSYSPYGDNEAAQLTMGYSQAQWRDDSDRPKKVAVTHRFLDDKSDSPGNDTHLSTSAPNSLHDFFRAQNWYSLRPKIV